MDIENSENGNGNKNGNGEIVPTTTSTDVETSEQQGGDGDGNNNKKGCCSWIHFEGVEKCQGYVMVRFGFYCLLPQKCN